MNSTVYICHNCPSCERITNYIIENNVKCEVVNISDNSKKDVPVVNIFPALYVNNKLKAYGNDILERIKPG